MRRIFRIVFIAYISIIILLGFFQRKLLYRPRQAERLPVADFANIKRIFPAASDVEICCRDGVTIRGWLLQTEFVRPGAESPKTPTRPLALFFHGNAGNRAGRVDWYQILQRAGADVLAIDYHGYGDSDGKMSESAMEMDCEAAWTCATEELGYEPRDIIIAGTSLGGAAAVYTAARHVEPQDTPAGLMTAATFSSMTDVAGSIYPWLPIRAVLVDRYPSDQRIGCVSCPVIILHGDSDSLVDQKFGKKLFESAPAKSTNGIAKKWVSMPGVNHRSLPVTGRIFFEQALSELIAGWRQQRADGHND